VTISRGARRTPLLWLAVVALSCCSPARPPTVSVAPELVIPALGDGGAAAPAVGLGVRFGHPPPVVGMAWTVTLRASSRSFDGAAEQVSLYTSDSRVEVLAVDGPAPSRLRVRFTRNAYTLDGVDTPSPIDGKEYFIDAQVPHVRTLSDLAAPVAESERVLDIFPDLGTRARVDQVLPDDALTIGARHDDLVAAILRVLHPRAWTLRAGAATLARTEGDHAVFNVSLDASSDSGLAMKLEGEARVRLRDAQLVELSLDGPYELRAPGKVEPAGVFRLRRSVEGP
jgi:hypothetical protein